MSTIIRLAIPSDLPAVQKLHLGAFKEIGESENSISISKEENQYLFVALDSLDEVIGYATLSSFNQHYFYCGWLAVKAEKRSAGVSGLLLSYLLDQVKAKVGKTLMVDSRNRFRGKRAIRPANLAFFLAGERICFGK